MLPLFALSAVVEGPQRGLAALRTVTWPAIGSVAFVGILATVVGFGVWGYLIRTYSASMIAPFSLPCSGWPPPRCSSASSSPRPGWSPRS